MREPTSRQSSIEVRLHGTPIADLAHTNAGRASLSWRPEAISRWGMNSTVFSSALPIGTTDSVGVEAFFGGLLPEGRGGDDKYEWSNARSSLKAVAQRLDPGGIFTRPTADRLNLLAYTTFNVAVGNTDAHAKNLSFVSDAQGRWRLAPLYDVTPQALFHEDAGGLAMFVAGRQRLAETRLSDLVAEGVSWGLSHDAAEATVRHTLEQLEGAVAEVPAAASIADHLPGYVRRVVGSLLQGGTAWLGGPTHPMFWPRIE